MVFFTSKLKDIYPSPLQAERVLASVRSAHAVSKATGIGDGPSFLAYHCIFIVGTLPFILNIINP